MSNISRAFHLIADKLHETPISKIPGTDAVYTTISDFFAPTTDEPMSIDYRGYDLQIQPGDFVSDQIYKQQYYEREVSEVIKEWVTEGSTAFDIGAHIGHHTLMMHDQVGKEGRVYAFEPNPEIADLLRQTVRMNSVTNVEVEQSVLSDEAGFVNLYVDPENSGSSSVKSSEEENEQIEVESIQLSEYIAENEINHIDFVKMDVQGAEINIIRDISQQLDWFETILLEVHTGTYLSDSEAEEIHMVLDKKGTLYTIPNMEECGIEDMKQKTDHHILWLSD